MTIRNLEALFQPGHVLVLGTGDGAAANQCLSNLERTVPLAQRTLVGQDRDQWECIARTAEWPSCSGAILLDRSFAEAGTVTRLAAAGCRALVVVPDQVSLEPLLLEARPHLLRILGPRSCGMFVSGRNVTTLPTQLERGGLALIMQSQSVASAALDWAAGRKIGFSWTVVTGAEADIDVADLLDYAALDRDTTAVVLQVGWIRGGRKFMSAARACARVKPTVVLQTPSHGTEFTGADPVRSAAFQRAGLIECRSMADLFDALNALDNIPPLSSNRILVAGNGEGVCALGVEALLSHGMSPVSPSVALRQKLMALAPSSHLVRGGVDLGPSNDEATPELLGALVDSHEAGAVLFIRSPTAGQDHAVVAARLSERDLGRGLVTVWLGLQAAMTARASSVANRIATFSSPDAAARALYCRWQYFRTQELLTQTPAISAVECRERNGTAELLQKFIVAGDVELEGEKAAKVFQKSGLKIGMGAEGYVPLRVHAAQHSELGLYLELTPHVSGLKGPNGYVLPPLDDLLAVRALQDIGYVRENDSETIFRGLSQGLIRVADLLGQHSSIQSLDLQLAIGSDAEVYVLPDGRIRLAINGETSSECLALAPYPEEMTHTLTARDGKVFSVRAVRPTDEVALIKLLEGMPADDIRLRFFCHIHYFSHAMAARMTQVDYDREVALVVMKAHELVAIATLIVNPDGATAEFAVLVEHRLWRSGVGRHLMEQLIKYARRRGIGQVVGEVLNENDAMRGLARALGFQELRHPQEPGVIRLSLVLAGENKPAIH